MYPVRYEPSALLGQTSFIHPPALVPGRSAARRLRRGALLSRGPTYHTPMGPGSAEQREARCTASGTRLGLHRPTAECHRVTTIP